MKLKLIIGLGLSICLGSLFGVWVIPRLNQPSLPTALWNDYVQARPLVDDSELILIGTYLDSTVHEIPEISPVDGKAHHSVTEVYRRFKVVESLKGDDRAEETIHVTWTAGYSKETDVEGKNEFLPYSTVPLEYGQEYVLFLDSLPLAPGYPEEYGKVVWTVTGEPGVAIINSEEKLLFQASERYKKEVAEGRHERPTGSAAPFELSKEELEALIGASNGDN